MPSGELDATLWILYCRVHDRTQQKKNLNRRAFYSFVLVSCLLVGQLVGTQEREGDPGLPRVDGIYTHLQRYAERNFVTLCTAEGCHHCLLFPVRISRAEKPRVHSLRVVADLLPGVRTWHPFASFFFSRTVARDPEYGGQGTNHPHRRFHKAQRSQEEAAAGRGEWFMHEAGDLGFGPLSTPLPLARVHASSCWPCTWGVYGSALCRHWARQKR